MRPVFFMTDQQGRPVLMGVHGLPFCVCTGKTRRPHWVTFRLPVSKGLVSVFELHMDRECAAFAVAQKKDGIGFESVGPR
jgi:hypothetical protein